ncbi:MAG: hypothetical protein CL868_06480 [Cytophagaceae bacterium]|nr:hypothetical protein [Cytophagaceae bacterium]|tara:strand:+ start:23761 stop:24462 length:702 start_codon:yes stop_codon:yes gene_type:complete
MSRKEHKYFNFPIQLISGFMVRPKETLGDIFSYVFYKLVNDFMEDQGVECLFTAMERVGEYLKNTGGDDDNRHFIYQRGELLHNSIPDKSPITGISEKVFWDYFNNHETKNKYDKICLLAFLASKSIIGPSKVEVITYKFLFSRMDGHRTVVPLEAISYEIATFYTPHKRSKIRDLLMLKWGLKTPDKNSYGACWSYKLSQENLNDWAYKRTEKYKLKKMREEKRARRKKLKE